MPPANDSFASAVVLTDSDLPFHATYFTTDATTEAGEPLALAPYYTLTRTVWYRYTPAADGLIAIATAGSSYPVAVVVYTGASLESLVRVAGGARYGAGPSANRGALRIDLVGGTTYSIQIGRTGSAGTMELDFNLSRMPSSLVRGTITAPSSGETVFAPPDLSGTFRLAGDVRIDDVYAVGYQATEFGGRPIGWTPSGQSLMPNGGEHTVASVLLLVWREDTFAVSLLEGSALVGQESATSTDTSYPFDLEVLFDRLPWTNDDITGDELPFTAKLGVLPKVFSLPSPWWFDLAVGGAGTNDQWNITDMLTTWQVVHFAIGVPAAVPARLATIVG